MKGPTISCSSAVLSRHDDEPPLPPEEQIAALSGQILAQISLEEIEHLENIGAFAGVRMGAEITALYLARSWHYRSPWWADVRLVLTSSAKRFSSG